MSEYSLYCFKESGNAYKVALMLELTGTPWTPIWVDFFNGETRGEAYREGVNEMGEVPVLENAGLKLTQTGAILHYLADETGKFGGKDRAEKLEILRWMFFDNHKLTSYTATYRFMTNFVDGADKAVTDFLASRMHGAFKVLNGHLEGRAFIAGDEPTIADFSACGYLFYPEEFGVTWHKAYPEIGTWLERISTLPGWRHPYDILPASAG
ncbi:MAG: glutathione S-transferase family protein [Hyphomicrobiales bacterium]